MMERIDLTAQDAVFELEAIRGDAEGFVNRIYALVEALGATLPEAQANDLVTELNQLALRIDELVDDTTVRVRDGVMQWGVPVDEIGCDWCGSADFSSQDCAPCSAIRSDGLRLARRLAGWMI